MSMRDLGIIDGPLLVFGGPYSNLQATMAMRAEAERLGVPASNVICTGDVVAYAADPAPCVDQIMSWGIPTVMGNCEESFGSEADDCGCGFEEGSACDALSQQWFAFANARLRPEQRAWMRDLPRTFALSMGGYSLAVVHGSAASINEFVFATSPDDLKAHGIAQMGVDVVVGGHSGVPFTQTFDSGVWHNAGVIGMPANDGTPRVWYSLIEAIDGGLRFSHHALSYDHATAAMRMREEKLAEAYASCLECGIWPNMDIMPQAEREKAGVAIKPHRIDWTKETSISRSAAE